MHFEAIIFDMDGLLIDSERYWGNAEATFLKSYGVEMTKELRETMMGRSQVEISTLLKELFNLPDSVQTILERRIAATSNIYNEQAVPMPGAESFIKTVRNHPVKSAIASGSSLERIDQIIKRFNWENYFDQLVSTDQVAYVGKPDPAIYNYTAKVLRVAPERCLVLEDSVNGVLAAKAAGMQCAAVLGGPWCYGDYSTADLVVDTLEDSKLHDFLGIKQVVAV